MSRGGAVWRPYTQMKTAPPPLKVAATVGVRLILDDGRRLIDGISSWWTACHGHGNPVIRDAVERQLRIMPHVMFGGLTHEPAERLAERLARLLPGDLDHVFFTDSGSVAVEVAMKMAVQLWRNRGVAGRTKFLAFRHGYHGDTLGAMSVCDSDGMHARLAGYVPEQILCDLPGPVDNAFEALVAAHRDELAAIMLEPLVQGAGGMKFHDAATLRRVAETARRHGVLLILDEIMTGFGRTGSMFACEQAGIVPDIICLSKALTGGTLPLAATVARRPVFEGFWSDDPADALMHGPTFMANPLACAAANASLDLFEQQDRIAEVLAIEAVLAETLEPCRTWPGIVDVRAKGAIGVVQVSALGDAAWLRQRFIERGIWARPFGDILYVTPPLSIEADDLTVLAEGLRDVAADWSARFGRDVPPPAPIEAADL